MAAGKKTGGRKKGTPNKGKQELQTLLADRFPGYHPVLAMADVANATDEDGMPVYGIETRMLAHREVAKYVEPQLKAIEHRAGDETKGLNFYMGFTDERVVSRPEVKGNGKANGSNGSNGSGPARPRPRAGQ